MTNILKNPDLSNWHHHSHLFQKDGKVITIEEPEHWDYTYFAKHPDDPARIPASLHRENGFIISAPWLQWEAGYVQRGVQLKGGQRYLAKASIKPDVNFLNTPVDLTAVMWRFWIENTDGNKVYTEWQMTSQGRYKQDEEVLFVFEVASDMTADYYFKARSFYAGNDCDLWIYSLTLEEVPEDYGGAFVPVLELNSEVAPPPPGSGIETGEGESETPPILPPVVGPSGLALGDVLTADDIDVIANGLRAVSQVTNNKAVIEGFEQLAAALEKLK